jgi:DNA-directed RNA polymerase subunit alpha
MLDLNNFYVTKETEADNKGVFVIGPLPKGYGHTLANSVRRILLSSLTGAAISSIKIAGAEHEYSTIKGMQDDVLTLILKLKQVVIKSYSEEPVKVKLNVTSKKGETRVVTAADIEADASIEIINKDVELTTVSDGAKLTAELTIENGRGYKTSDAISRDEIGLIPVDALFSPVENVTIDISNARVGQRTDYDQIKLTITTNGAITPTESLEEAFGIFNNISERLLELVKAGMTGAEKKGGTTEAKNEPTDEFGIQVSELKLSTRLKNALTNSAITDLRVLDGKTKEELMEIKGMGEKSVDELVEIMQNNNLTII